MAKTLTRGFWYRVLVLCEYFQNVGYSSVRSNRVRLFPTSPFTDVIVHKHFFVLNCGKNADETDTITDESQA